MGKITLKTTHQEVVELMKKMILNGELRKGEKINEMSLCRLLGVSRTPIREAMRILHAMGLIVLVPHRGAFVSEFSAEETSDMFEVMSVLEGMSARLATEKMTQADYLKIKALHEDLEKHYSSKNLKAYSETNQEFHSLIQNIAGNKALNEAAYVIQQKTALWKQKQLYLPKRLEQSIEEHRNLLEAFRTRDGKKAEKLMSRHLKKQGKALMNQYLKDSNS